VKALDNNIHRIDLVEVAWLPCFNLIGKYGFDITAPISLDGVYFYLFGNYIFGWLGYSHFSGSPLRKIRWYGSQCLKLINLFLTLSLTSRARILWKSNLDNWSVQRNWWSTCEGANSLQCQTRTFSSKRNWISSSQGGMSRFNIHNL